MVRPWALALFLGVVLPAATAAQEVVHAEAPHIVIQGNTLWDLSEAYCQTPFEWPLIYDANRGVVEDPHWIYPGETLQIACAGGVVATVEVVSATDGETTLRETAGPRRVPGRTVFYPYSAARADANATMQTEAEDAPLLHMAVTADRFHQTEWLVDALGDGGSIGRLEEPAPVDKGRGANEALLVNQRVRIRMEPDERPALGTQLVSYRLERVIEGLGRVALPTGRLTVTSVEDAGVVAVLHRSYARVAVGDHVRIAPTFDLTPGAEPAPVDGGMEASILAFAEDRRMHNMDEVAFVDVGLGEGVDVGDEFQVLDGAHDGWNAEPIATLQILRVAEGWSAARIMEILSPTVEPGQTLRLVRKMP